MTDPRRLLEEAGLTESERSALVAAQDMQPPKGLAESSWAALAAALGPPPGGAGTPPAGGAGPAAGGGGAAAGGGATSLLGKLAGVSVAKAIGIGVAVGGLVTAAVVALPPVSSFPARGEAHVESRSSAPPADGLEPRRGAGATAVPRLASAAPATQESPGEREATPAEATLIVEPISGPVAAPSGAGTSARAPQSAPSDRVVVARGVSRAEPTNPLPQPAGPAPSVAAFDGPRELTTTGEPFPLPSAATPPSVQEEARLVGRAREALRGGDPALALQMLEESRVQFPGGAMMQEREALAIEALVRLGRRDSAAERASRFFRDFPDSPYVARVRSVVR